MSDEIFYLEDLVPGRTWEWGEYSITKDEIVALARQYDPQPFHVDEEAANKSVFRGLTASSLHTLAVAYKMFHLDAGPRFKVLAQLSMTDVTFPNPVRPGDSLRMSMECLSVRESTSRPDRGIFVYKSTLLNQRGDACLSSTHTILVPKRSAV